MATLKEKAAVKIGIQYQTTINDARF